jgi:FtsZ-interacting cell division protein ZipA
MGLEYYVFALFIAALICIIALICKVLFSNVKRQRKMLDDRESQILQLYTSAETLMEEFNEQVKMTTDELKELETRANTQVMQAQKAQQIQQAQQMQQMQQSQQTTQSANLAAFELPPELEKKEQLLDKLPRTLPLDANRIRIAGEVLERAERIIKSENVPPAPPQEKENTGAVFQKFFDDTAESTPLPPTVRASRAQTRTEEILELAAEGKTDVEIASRLGITRNEVLLVVGLKK